MSIKLDWELDTKQGIVQRVGEDPESKRRRRTAQFRFILVFLIFILLGGGIVGAVVLRLREVDAAIDRQLRASVEAEVTALRIGDQQAYLNAQWRAEEDESVTAQWIARQTQVFYTYQSLKQNRDVNLTGRVLDVTIEGQNGRAHVEEIIDGVPYGRVWFYWRFDDGWRHVPPAYGFWGDSRQITTEQVSVLYQDVDAPVASAMAAELPRWLDLTCSVFDCAGLPQVVVEIVPDETLSASWADGEVWRLRVPSPYIERARLDQPFDPSLKLKLAALWVDRWTASVETVDWGDAAYLRSAIGDYLVEQLAGIDTASHLITSLVDTYGVDALRRLLAVMSPQATINVLTLAVGQPLDALPVDWRDFLTYRLQIEERFVEQRAESAFYALYDTTNPNVMAAAAARFSAGATGSFVEVASVIPERAEDGTLYLQAVIAGEQSGLEAVFRLVNGDWKRIG